MHDRGIFFGINSRMAVSSRNLFLSAALVLAALLSADAALAAELTGLTVEVNEDGSEQVAVTASEEIEVQRSFTLTNPDRVVIDLPEFTGSLSLPKKYKGVLLKGVRVGKFNATTSRLVMDLAAPATLQNITEGNPLIVGLKASKPVAAGGAAKAKVKPEETKPLIAIDAGHGGQDPGAIGLHKTRERDVTLAFTLALRKALLRTGRYRVALTREDDHFIMLHERVNLARQAHADLMISLHADSNPRAEAQGLSIYTLSATASDDEAAALAEHENKADIISGMDLSTTDQDVANILIDLTQRETMNKSTIFADAIMESLHPKITRLSRTHRFAGFRVLKAPDIPSVLIELGFLSNRRDEKLLLSPEYRELVVASIIKGIDRYYAAQ